MNSKLVWLIVIEFVLLFLFSLIRYILARIEKNKIDKILKYMQENTKQDKDIEKRFEACLEQIKKVREVELNDKV